LTGLFFEKIPKDFSPQRPLRTLRKKLFDVISVYCDLAESLSPRKLTRKLRMTHCHTPYSKIAPRGIWNFIIQKDILCVLRVLCGG